MLRSRLLHSFVFILCIASPLRAEGPATAPPLPKGVKLVPNLEYANVEGKSLLLDMYLPETVDKPLPVIIWIHGGGWVGGDKRERIAVPMVGHGYAVVSINYRFSNEAVYPAQIEDCKAAVRWVRAHANFYNLDPAHIGVWGASAGGHLVALLGTTGDVKELEGDEGNPDQSSRVQAVCDWFGPTDLLKIAEEAKAGDVKNVANADAPDSPPSRLIGGPIQDNKDKTEKANPIAFITKDAAPFLIMHGDKDPLVPLAQSEILRDALQKAGVEAKLEVIHGAGHGFGNHEIFKTVQDFFDAHLKPAPVAPQTPGAGAK
jgi:acetyl esterase/lipase